MSDPWERNWSAAEAPAANAWSFDDALKAEGVSGRLADVARSVYQQESSSGKNARTSNAGARGGMQILPGTFAEVADKGWSIDDQDHNARAGIRYLKQMYAHADGDPALTATGYYSGRGGMNKARAGVAVFDPRNPNAPSSLEYGRQVAGRLPSEKSAVARGVETLVNSVVPSAQAAEPPQAQPDPWDRDWSTAQPAPAVMAGAEQPSAASSIGRQLGLTARAGIRGVAAMPAMLADGITGPVNEGLDFVRGQGNGYRFPRQAVALDNLLTRAGLPVPQNATERVVQEAAGAVAGVGPVVAVGGALSRAAGALPKAVGQILAAGPGVQAVSGAASAGAATATKESGGGEGAQMIAALVGGITPSALSYGGAAALRGAMRGGEAGRQRVAENIALFEQAGATPTIGQATEGRWQRGVETALGRTPGGAGVIAKAGERQANRMAEAVKNLSDSLAPGADAMTAGESIASGVKGFKVGLQQVQVRLYNELDKHIPALAPIQTTRTQQALRDLNADIAGAPELSKWFRNARIQGIDGAMQSDLQQATVAGALPYQAIKKLRTLVGRELADGTLMSDVPRSKWSALYGALSEDLGDAATAAGPAAAERWNWANVYTTTQLGRLEELQSIVNRDAPEKIFNAAISGAAEGNTVISRVISALPKENRKEVAAALLQRLGRATAGHQNDTRDAFSSETFLTNLSKLSPEARQTIFGRLGSPEAEKKVAELARIAKIQRDSGKVFANPSGTAGGIAQIGIGSALAAALYSQNPVAIAGAIGLPVGANALARAATAQSLVRGLARKTVADAGAQAAALGSIARTTQTAPPQLLADSELDPWMRNWGAPAGLPIPTEETPTMSTPEAVPEAAISTEPAPVPAPAAQPAAEPVDAEITQGLQPVELPSPEQVTPVVAQGADEQPQAAAERPSVQEDVAAAASEQPPASLSPIERFKAEARAAKGIEQGDILNRNAQPFTVKLPAIRAAKEAGEGFEVVPVRGGYVVRRVA